MGGCVRACVCVFVCACACVGMWVCVRACVILCVCCGGGGGGGGDCSFGRFVRVHHSIESRTTVCLLYTHIC